MKELWMHLLGFNLIRDLLRQSAKTFSKIPRMLSFKYAVQAVSALSNTVIDTTISIVNKMTMGLLKVLSDIGVGNRFREAQPRAVKRRKKCLNLLIIPRNLAKRKLVNGR